MSNVKLTIGIPTWNRASEITDAFDSILAQTDVALLRQVEILISDNASTDATQAVVRGYAERFPGLFSVYRNSENIGVARNIDSLFQHAQGEFVFILSDDDALEPDAISEVMIALEGHPDIDVMFVMCSGWNGQACQPSPSSSSGKTGADNTPGASCVYYASGVEYYRERKSLCYTCISGNMFRKAAWKKANVVADRTAISVQLYAAVQILARGSICVIEKPLVKYRNTGCSQEQYLTLRGDGVNTGWPFIYFFDMVSACRGGRRLYPEDIYRSFYLTCVRGVFYTLLNVKARGGFIDRAWFEKRLAECFDPQCFGWLIGFHRLLVRVPGVFFVIPDKLYCFGRKLYFALQPRR